MEINALHAVLAPICQGALLGLAVGAALLRVMRWLEGRLGESRPHVAAPAERSPRYNTMATFSSRPTPRHFPSAAGRRIAQRRRRAPR